MPGLGLGAVGLRVSVVVVAVGVLAVVLGARDAVMGKAHDGGSSVWKGIVLVVTAVVGRMNEAGESSGEEDGQNDLGSPNEKKKSKNFFIVFTPLVRQ